MSWFSRRKTSLDDIGDGADARIVVIVASPDALESALAPMHAAAFKWTLLTQRTSHGTRHGGGGTSSSLTPFASGWRGGPLVARAPCGRYVEISLGHAKLSAPIDPEDGAPMGESRRAVEIYGAAAITSPGPAFVREFGLMHGQALTLVGRVVPVKSKTGYREAAVANEISFQTEGEITLEDHTLDVV